MVSTSVEIVLYKDMLLMCTEDALELQIVCERHDHTGNTSQQNNITRQETTTCPLNNNNNKNVSLSLSLSLSLVIDLNIYI